MLVVSSQYWNQVHGSNPEQVKQDLEGMQTMRRLGANMAWLLKCLEAGKNAGVKIGYINHPIHLQFHNLRVLQAIVIDHFDGYGVFACFQENNLLAFFEKYRFINVFKSIYYIPIDILMYTRLVLQPYYYPFLSKLIIPQISVILNKCLLRRFL
jgi:hypothetical protein